MSEEILIIKHGALGDIMLSFGPLRAIRNHHQGARMTLLTTPAYVDLFRACPDVDEVWVDPRPTYKQPRAWLQLIQQLRSRKFARVYDLQTSDRSSFYFWFMRGRPEWSGLGWFVKFRDTQVDRQKIHTLERQKNQLLQAGIADVPRSDVSWLQANVAALQPTGSYALLVPGGSAHRPEKRWPADSYGHLAQQLLARGITPLIVGGGADAAAIDVVMRVCPQAVNLKNKTTIPKLISLARGARLAVGNDTGPMHAIALTGVACVVLFSSASNPARCQPRGPVSDDSVQVIQRPSLADLSVDAVMQTLMQRAWLS